MRKPRRRPEGRPRTSRLKTKKAAPPWVGRRCEEKGCRGGRGSELPEKEGG